MAIKPYNPANHRIEHIEIKGNPLKLDKIYRIVVGGPQFFKNMPAAPKETGIKAHDALKHYLGSLPVITIDPVSRVICI